jgi:hypothetical protein
MPSALQCDPSVSLMKAPSLADSMSPCSLGLSEGGKQLDAGNAQSSRTNPYKRVAPEEKRIQLTVSLSEKLALVLREVSAGQREDA